jgi:hypothetical protein
MANPTVASAVQTVQEKTAAASAAVKEQYTALSTETNNEIEKRKAQATKAAESGATATAATPAAAAAATTPAPAAAATTAATPAAAAPSAPTEEPTED